MTSAVTDPRSGLKRGWLVTDNYAAEMDANLLLLGQAGFHLSVKDRDLTAPPGGESDGDTYIPATTATGDWVGHEDEIAVFNGTDYTFYTPRTGWIAYIEDEAKLSAYASGAWSAGVAL
jgi:Protein of unknown function (DUF2793)